MKFFRFVMFNLVIYGCFEGNAAKIGSENAALKEKTNKVGGEENKIVTLDEEFPNEPYVEIRTKRETDGKTEKYSAGYISEDENGEKETDGLGTGDEGEYIQSDEPSAPIDGNDEKKLNVQRNSSSGRNLTGTTTRALGQTVSANVSATVTGFVTNTPSGNATINIAPTTRSDGNSSNTVVTNPLYSTPHMRAVNTIDAATVKSSPLLSSQVVASTSFSVLVITRSTIVDPTRLATEQSTTIETTTKGDGDVLDQKEENEGRKTLFGFVTIEILVALLAGAACAVILLVFLVHRLKKRNEGSYELQETLNLNTAGYAEEKEVFV